MATVNDLHAAERTDDALTARLAQHARTAAADGRPLRWTQHHVTHPPAEGGHDRVLTGWVDVRLLDGIDADLGFSWTVTVDGDGRDLLDHGALDLSVDSIAKLPAADGSTVRLIRGRPWQLWVDRDVDVHHLLFVGPDTAAAAAAELADRDGWSGQVGHDEVSFTVARGSLPSEGQIDGLRTVADLQRHHREHARYAVDGGWTVSRLCAALRAWVYALTGVEVGVVYVDEPDRDLDPDPLLERVEDAQRTLRSRGEQVALLDADGPGGFPAGAEWVVLPACGWRWLPEVPLHGEKPQRCVRPARSVVVGPAARDGDLPQLTPVDGQGRFPSGVPVCHRHRDAAAGEGLELVDDPRYDPGDEWPI